MHGNETRPRQEPSVGQEEEHLDNKQPEANIEQADNSVGAKDPENTGETDRQDRDIPELRFRFHSKVQRGKQPSKAETEQGIDPRVVPRGPGFGREVG